MEMTVQKYDDQYDNNNSICPYCGDEYQVEAEDYSEEPRAVQCQECMMMYYLRQNFEVTHIATPDCELNGEKHKFEIMENKTFKKCCICGKIEMV